MNVVMVPLEFSEEQREAFEQRMRDVHEQVFMDLFKDIDPLDVAVAKATVLYRAGQEIPSFDARVNAYENAIHVLMVAIGKVRPGGADGRWEDIVTKINQANATIAAQLQKEITPPSTLN